MDASKYVHRLLIENIYDFRSVVCFMPVGHESKSFQWPNTTDSPGPGADNIEGELGVDYSRTCSSSQEL